HTVVITWGGGTPGQPSEGSTTLTLDAGVTSFSAGHQYLDDNPTCTPADVYAISVTVTDNHGASCTAGPNVTVNNVAPTVTTLSGAASINENDTYTLSGTLHDPGTLDTHTVVITWGGGTVGQPSEGSTTLNNADLTYLGNGDWSFTATHQYLDDNPTGTASDAYAISVTVTDDDTGTATVGTSVAVNNVAPLVGPIDGPSPGPGVRGQTLAFAGSFTDVGTQDTHEVSWDFGDGTVVAFHSSTDAGALAPTHV